MWYFFTSGERKYPRGERPNRTANGGYWKASGASKAIVHNGVEIGFKQALAYYRGKAPKGVKTCWLMQEFKVSSELPPVIGNKKGDHDGDNVSMRLDDYVLCRIYKNPKGTCKYHMKQQALEEDIPLQEGSSVDTTDPNNEIPNWSQKQFLLPAVDPSMVTSYNATSTSPSTYYCDQMEPSTDCLTSVGTCQSSFQSNDGIEIAPLRINYDNIATPSTYCSDQVETAVTCSTNMDTCCSDQREQEISCSTNVGTSQYSSQGSDSTHIVPPVVPPISNYNMSNLKSNIEKSPVASCSSTNVEVIVEEYCFKSSDSNNKSVDNFDWDLYLANL